MKLIDVIIVVYNKECSNTINLNYLLNFSKNEYFDINVFDNSTIKTNNDKFCKENKIKYYTTGKNIGLSRAYNYVINNLKLSSKKYVLILDDDTILNDEYLNELILKTKTSESDIYLPLVYDKIGLLSPSYYKEYGRIKRFNSRKTIDFKNITAINSGMLINENIFKNIKYDEHLFLDFVDHDFMRQVSKKYSLSILDSMINQEFSRNTKGSYESTLSRFKIYRKDFKTFSKKYKLNKFYSMLNIFKLRMIYFIQFKKIIFLYVR